MVNVSEAITKIKTVGSGCVRSVPMPNQPYADGDYQIEIKQEGQWTPIVTGVKKHIAESIIQQALNRVILG